MIEFSEKMNEILLNGSAQPQDQHWTELTSKQCFFAFRHQKVLLPKSRWNDLEHNHVLTLLHSVQWGLWHVKISWVYWSILLNIINRRLSRASYRGVRHSAWRCQDWIWGFKTCALPLSYSPSSHTTEPSSRWCPGLQCLLKDVRFCFLSSLENGWPMEDGLHSV